MTIAAFAKWTLTRPLGSLLAGIIQELDAPLAKLMFMDSASVIQECIEIINETARGYGVSLN